MPAPRPGVHRFPGGAGADRRSGYARLILPLVRQQRAVVDVADPVQPLAGHTLHQAGVVDIQPRSRRRSHCLQADLARQWLSAGGEQHLVDFQLAAVVQLERHGAGPPGRRSFVTETSVRTSTPDSLRPRATSSPTKASIRGSTPEPRTSSVTEDPTPCQAVAISTATPPPPTTASRAGTCRLSVASRLVHGSPPAM